MQSRVPGYFNDFYLKENKINYRQYQDNIFKRCKSKNSLVVLPTGLGKTIIGILLLANSLKNYEKSKILVLAPTRPLAAQHRDSCVKFLKVDQERICLLTGKINPDKRVLLFNESRIIISTPQVIKNDLMRGRYHLNEVSLIIFDEAHRTKGNYAYTFVSREYINDCSDPLILGLTASPGKNYLNIQELCDNLYIENIVFKTYDDEDVKDYICEIGIFLERVELPIKILEISEVWNHLFKKYLRFFIDRGLINRFKNYYSKLDFLRIAHDLTFSLRYIKDQDEDELDDSFLDQLFYQNPRIIDVVKDKKLNIHSIFSYCSSCISLLHGKDLLETQDISLFKSFMERIKFKAEQEILSAKRIYNSDHFNLINSVIEKEGISELSHPKLEKLISIIDEELDLFQNNKILIFTQYREMAELLKNKLRTKYLNQLVIEKFIGQATKPDDMGFPQNKQIEILQEFRENKINILIATSVAEEGLDIPNVDAVIFYEPIPSEIRLIQRRGRTGRHAPGRCYILITKDTVDVPFQKVASRKEDTMNSVLLEPDLLTLTNELNRRKITFQPRENKYDEFDFIKNFQERREKEKELLANRSIEDIINTLDNFSKSDEYKRLKNCGVIFYTDIVKLNKSKLKKNILKMKGKKQQQNKKPKRYLNRNLKTLINLAKLYCEEGKVSLSEFQTLAEEEDITDRKFYVHFNQACHLGYIKKDKKNFITFLKDYC